MKDKRLWIFDDHKEAENVIEKTGMQDLEVVEITIKEWGGKMRKCSKCNKEIGLFIYTENGKKICEDCFNKLHKTRFHEELSASMLKSLNKAINDQNADNLRTQFAEKDKEITSYKEVLETYKKKPVNIYQVEIRNLQVDKAELKLEIEKLKDKLKRTEKAMHEEVMEHLEYYNADQKQLRHEICEKIRKLANPQYVEYGDYCVDVLFRSEFEAILDQIERGDE